MLQPVKEESFSEREERILKFWEEHNLFEKSVENRKKGTLFSFYDGPPFATGLPHYGHILAGTVKDVVHRYKTMRGYYVPRRFGWDCHGLPVENEIEKSKNLSGASSIEQFGVGEFNEECRKIVLRYTKEWEGTVKRMGRWVDFKNTYHTMDLSFMESVWWVFQQLFEKGLVYEGFKVMPFSAKLGTPLSNFEATQNYKEVDDPAIVVSFQLLDEPDTSLLAWTTTPWTLISNLAVAVGPEIDYSKVKDETSGKHYILGKNNVTSYFVDRPHTIISTFKGKTLAGKKYRPLLPYFAEHQDAFRVLVDTFVTTEDGTGLVHMAPAFGESDFFACQREGIEVVCPVDVNGHFTSEIPEYVGLFVKDADKEIIKRLKKEGKLFHQTTIRHRYPFCWRSDTPLIYKVVRTWFVSVEEIKDNLLKANDQIHWMPEHIKSGRFGKWLEGARDWAISRNRYWGTPIPIWRSEDGEIHAIGSIKELETLTGKKIHDLHRHYIDDLTFEKKGKTFRRVPEVFDCWFESGSMPYAQNHYPFENAKLFDEGFPADFIAEGIDQTRGWFYTLTVLAAALFDKPAFKNVIVNGLILAEDGSKMSKRLKNYPDPLEVVKRSGADAIRLYMLNSPAVRADDLSFSEKGVEQVLRHALIPLWNAYSFFVTYARICEWQPQERQSYHKPKATIDCWILSLLNKLVKQVETGMDQYDLNRAVEPFVDFIDQLTNWYIRRSRRRFWEEKESQDRTEALETLYQVLLTLTKVSASFIPFLSEAMYINLRSKMDPESVHMCDFPAYNENYRDEHLEDSMAAVQRAVSLGHALRKDYKLKVRQPLPAAHIVSGNSRTLAFLSEQKYLIEDELNVKELILSSDETKLVNFKAKPNFRLLGKKVGKLMPAVQKAVGQFDFITLQKLSEGKKVTLLVEGTEVELTPEDVEVERVVHADKVSANEGDITILLDTTLNESLIQEGLAREIVNKINTMRREANFDVTDRIKIDIETTEKVKDCFSSFGDYIRKEVLAVNVHFQPTKGCEWDLNGEKAVIALSKVNN